MRGFLRHLGNARLSRYLGEQELALTRSWPAWKRGHRTLPDEGPTESAMGSASGTAPLVWKLFVFCGCQSAASLSDIRRAKGRDPLHRPGSAPLVHCSGRSRTEILRRDELLIQRRLGAQELRPLLGRDLSTCSDRIPAGSIPNIFPTTSSRLPI